MLRFRLGLTPNSNVWVGAWWIGFLLAAVLCAILALPLLAFPPALPGKLESISPHFSRNSVRYPGIATSSFSSCTSR